MRPNLSPTERAAGIQERLLELLSAISTFLGGLWIGQRSIFTSLAVRFTILLLMVSGTLSALTTVTDTVRRADGSLASGSLNVQWQSFRTASGQFVPAGSIRNVPIVNGVFTVQLENNVSASPQGTSYVVSYSITGSQPTQWRWFVPDSLTPVGLSVVQFPAPGLVGGSASVAPAQLQQAGATLGNSLIWNGAYWAPGAGGGSGSPLFSSILTGTNTAATMTVGSGASLTYSGSGTINANRITGTTITGIVGNSGTLLSSSGTLVNGRLLASDASFNAVDSGVAAAAVVLTSGSYANPAWITSLNASKLAGTVACAQMPALTGDATTSAGACATTVTSTNGLPFAASATTNALNASNISSGTLPAARLPAIDLAVSGGGGGTTGQLAVSRLNASGAPSSTTFLRGDGSWQSVSAGGTVTNSSGALAAGNLIIGNSGNDVTILGALGTTTQVLHGNPGGNPSWGAVSLTADVTGTLATANGGLGTTSIAFSGPSGAVKTFTLPNADATILTNAAAVTMAQGGTGADFSAIAKGGLLVGASAGALVLKTVGADGEVLTADAASAGGIKWAAVVGTGTVTSIATTAPITGGTITTTGTIACPTCVTAASALTSNRLVLGAGSQASAVLGSPGTSTTVLHGNSGGAPSFAAVDLTTDVSGALPATSGGTGLTSGTQTYNLRVKPNTGNNTTLEFISPLAFRASDYDYTAQAPGGSLSAATPATVTLSPCPLGIKYSSTWAQFYISAGTGTPEVVSPTGGTCTSGAASGTVQFTPANNHTGAWTVSSPTFGVQEAIYIAQAAGGGLVTISPGAYTLRGTISITASNIILQGAGVEGAVITRTGDFGNSVYAGTGLINIHISGFSLYQTINYAEGPPPTVVNKPTSGAHVKLENCAYCSVHDTALFNMPYGIELDTVGWTRAYRNTIKSVWDASYAAVQIGIAGIRLTRTQSGYGYPTYAWVEENVITGYQSAARTITVNGNNILNHIDPTGPKYGVLVESCEVCWIRNNTTEYMNDSGIGIIANAPLGGGLTNVFLALDIAGNYIDYNRLAGIKFDMSADEANRFALGTRIHDNWILGTNGTINGIYFAGATTPTDYVRTAHETTIANNIFRSTLGSGIFMLAGGLTSITGNIIDQYNALNSFPTNSINLGVNPPTGDRLGNSAVYATGAVTALTVTGNRLGGNSLGTAYDGVSIFTINGITIGNLLFQSVNEGEVITAPNSNGGVQVPSSRSVPVPYDPAFFLPVGPVTGAAYSSVAVTVCGALDVNSTISAGLITSATTGACAPVLTFTGAVAANGWACSISNQTTANLIRQTASTTSSATFSGTTVSGDVLSYSCSAY